MPNRLYIIPAVGVGTPDDPRRAKYLGDNNPPSVGADWWDYGFQPTFLVGAFLEPTDDATLVANVDVIPLPVDLTTSISGGAVQQFTNALEAQFIPGTWISGGTTWTVISKALCAMFSYMQRLYGIVGNTVLFDGTGNKTLNAQYGGLPAQLQIDIVTAANLQHLDPSFITPTTQVRAMLKELADQAQNRSYKIGPVNV